MLVEVGRGFVERWLRMRFSVDCVERPVVGTAVGTVVGNVVAGEDRLWSLAHFPSLGCGVVAGRGWWFGGPPW